MSLVTLIVDDDPMICFIQKKVLRVHEISRDSLTFSNGLGALSYLQNNYVPENHYLIFLDINMPVMNGWDFLREINDQFSERNLYVIILSSSVQVSDRNKAQSFNHVVEYLEKPMKPADLEQIKEDINSWLYAPVKVGLGSR
jgi:CheY-like chemotaxis protein